RIPVGKYGGGASRHRYAADDRRGIVGGGGIVVDAQRPLLKEGNAGRGSAALRAAVQDIRRCSIERKVCSHWPVKARLGRAVRDRHNAIDWKIQGLAVD